MSILHNFLWLCLMTFMAACSSSHTGKHREQASQAPRSGEIRAADEGIMGIAAREVVRRQEQIRRADTAALEANRASAEGDQEAAIRSYRKALDSLPSEE